MVTAATKKFREIFAIGLLGVAALYFISGASLLFKDDVGLDFSGRAAAFGYVFTHPVIVVALVASVALVSGFGEASKNAKVIVMAALGIGAISLLFALISWFSGFGAGGGGRYSSSPELFGGVIGAGKIVGIFLGLAQLGLLGLALFFAFTVFQTFPKAVQGAPQQWAGQQGYYGQPQQGWVPPDQGYAQQPQQPHQQPQPQQAWGQQPEQPAWSPPVEEPAGQQAWGQQPQQQAWGQQPEQQAWGQQPEQQAWGQQPEQQAWSPPAQEPAASPANWVQPDETTAFGESPTSDASGEDSFQGSAGAAEDETTKDGGTDDGDQPPQQGGWWQQPSQ